jgi:hypothetical protein
VLPSRTLPHCEIFLEAIMFKGGLLWLIGIPLPIILVLWLTGFLS